MMKLRSYPLLLAGLLQLAPLWRSALVESFPVGGPLIVAIRSLLIFSGVVGGIDAVSGATGVTIVPTVYHGKVGTRANFTINLQNDSNLPVDTFTWVPVAPAGVLPPGLKIGGTPIFGNLYIGSITGIPTVAGTYVVQVTASDSIDPIDYTTTGRVTIVIAPGNSPGSITSQPQSQTVTEGDTATFQVGVAGAAPLALQWYHGTSLIVGGTNATLTLTNVPLTAAGPYSVSVSNQFGGQLSSTALLTVNPKVVVPPFSIGSPRWINGILHFTLPTVSGASYTVQSLAALPGATWLTLTNLGVQTVTGTVEVQTPATGDQGWYRVVSAP